MFSHSGHVAGHGFWESGPHDDDDSKNGLNDSVLYNWIDIDAGYQSTGQAHADSDLANLWNAVLAVLGSALGVLGVVIAIATV
jgi:hypothetical protein